MNVRLKYEMPMTAAIYFGERFRVNTYEISFHFITNSESSEDNNIALERIKYFVNTVMDSTVFINQNNIDQSRKLVEAGCSVTTLPEEPVDQIVGMMLFCKFNAICDDYLKIIDLEIASVCGGDVWYKHNFLESLGPFEEDGWWNQNNLAHADSRIYNSDSKVFKIYKDTEWHDIDLHWSHQDTDSEDVAKDLANVLQFTRDEN